MYCMAALCFNIEKLKVNEPKLVVLESHLTYDENSSDTIELNSAVCRLHFLL